MKKKKRVDKNKNNIVLISVLIFWAIVVFIIGVVCGLFYYYSEEVPPVSELKHYDLKMASEVYDKDDNLIFTFAVEKRKLTNISELPDYITKGMIAIEDKSFKEHWGVDLYGFLRALLMNIKRLGFSQGASTITQQLSRNMFLSLDKTIVRKIKEIIVSVQIEKIYSKEEILEMYFNKVLFGHGLYGIEAAANKFFDKDAKNLTIAEAALICGMPQRPSWLNPYKYPKRAINRRNIVLRRMMEENVITKEEFLSAKSESLNLAEIKTDVTTNDYFIDYIRQTVEKNYGTNKLFASGLKIYTTIDMELTNYADSLLKKQLTNLEEKNDYEFKYIDFPADSTDIKTPYLQGGVFVIEPETGYVRVMIGGRDFKQSKFNRITQARRQPGSSFKPILYTCALENGYTPATVIKDEVVTFVKNERPFWSAHNYSRKNYGYTRMRDALKYSRNVYAVKMIYDLGPDKVVSTAKRFGLTTRINPVYSLSIGTCEVKPIELITAFTTFPNNGERVNPIFIRKIENENGNVIFRSETKYTKVTDPKIAYLMTDMMTSVINEGTGRGVRWRNGGYRWNAAGKTGTTDDYRDAWFIGFNKKLVTGIWVGFDNNNSLGRNKTGANVALPIWPPLMKSAVYNDAKKDLNGNPILDSSTLDFIEPDGIVKKNISKRNGLLPKSRFTEIISEKFIAGTEPTPLSDSLRYNFYPTFYRINECDSLVINFGGSSDSRIQPEKIYIDYRHAKVYFHNFKRYWDKKMMVKEAEEYMNYSNFAE